MQRRIGLTASVLALPGPDAAVTIRHGEPIRGSGVAELLPSERL